MIIYHNSLVNQWDDQFLYENAQKLVLGSFNPHNPNGINPDFYYGRPTNHFWKSIARNLKLNEDYFLNSLENKKEVMVKNKFYLLDIIDSIEVLSENENILPGFVNDNIFTGFSDAKIFTSNTRNVTIQRAYNKRIVELIQLGNIKTIIHTMGNNRIDTQFTTTPKELGLGANGFQGYINEIVRTSNREGANFITISHSPSQYAVNAGGTDIHELDKWIKKHILN